MKSMCLKMKSILFLYMIMNIQPLMAQDPTNQKLEINELEIPDQGLDQSLENTHRGLENTQPLKPIQLFEYIDQNHQKKEESHQLLQKIMEAEPQLLSLQQLIIKQNRLEASHFSDLNKQANQQAFLPQITAKFSYNEDADLENQHKYMPIDLSQMQPKEYINKNQAMNGYVFGLESRWNFNEYIFNPQQVSIARENRYASKERNQLLMQITTIYYDRIKVKLKLTDTSLSVDDHLALEIKLLELTAQIDAMTQGEFSKMMKSMH